jgi:hypothetical protein
MMVLFPEDFIHADRRLYELAHSIIGNLVGYDC